MITRLLLSTLLVTAGTPTLAQDASLRNAAVEAELRVARHAQEILATRAAWNQTDHQNCDPHATTFSLYCALMKAQQDVAGAPNKNGAVMDDARDAIDFMASKDYPARLVNYNNDPDTSFADIQELLRIIVNRLSRRLATAAASPAASPGTGPTHCDLHLSNGAWSGACDHYLDGGLSLSVSRAKAITSGAWRRDAQPASIWSGTLKDSGGTDDVEIEAYGDGTGAMRTPDGWFPVSAFSVDATDFRFVVDSEHEVPPNDVDRAIIQRASVILSSDAVWNRADDRTCPSGAKTWSIYCSIEQAEIDITGGFHHRRPAAELVRDVVDDRTKDRPYHHRLMDYNNDPTTTLADVKSLFAEAIARIK